MKAEKVPLEHAEQCAVVAWFNANYPEHYGRLAASSGGARMRPATAKKEKAAGMAKGYPDLNLLIPRHGNSGLFIEMKRVKGGTLSREQADWLAWLNAQGFMAVVCKGSDAAIETIRSYLAA
jgi:hypothetical protein